MNLQKSLNWIWLNPIIVLQIILILTFLFIEKFLTLDWAIWIDLEMIEHILFTKSHIILANSIHLFYSCVWSEYQLN